MNNQVASWEKHSRYICLTKAPLVAHLTSSYKSIISLWTPQTKWKNSFNMFHKNGAQMVQRTWTDASARVGGIQWKRPVSYQWAGPTFKSPTIPNVSKKEELKPFLFIPSGSAIKPSGTGSPLFNDMTNSHIKLFWRFLSEGLTQE